MSDRQMLTDSAARIFADHCEKGVLDRAERGEFSDTLWQTLRANGFAELARRDGGFALADAFAVLRTAGRHAVPLPLAETLLANRFTDGDGLASIGFSAGDHIVAVPWGRRADTVLGVDAISGECRIVRAPVDVTPGANLAGEPRDTVAASGALPLAVDAPVLELLALARAVQMAGCLERVLELAIGYATEREQFGRAISKFQAIQHYLAVMAAEVAAASRAADAAVAAAPEAAGTVEFALDVAAAKARVGEAAGVCAEIAHQVHGAMGFTHEHQLHHFTRRLWAWRDEAGAERFWQQRLGRHIAGLGADDVWRFVASRG